MRPLVLLLFFVIALPTSAQAPPAVQQTPGPCSVAMFGNNNQVFTCQGLDKKTADQILKIVNRIMANQLDPALVLAKLDEIQKAVGDIQRSTSQRRLTPEQKQALAKALSPVCLSLPTINVTASNGNQEAQRYAVDFVDALRRGGCKSDLSLPIPSLTPDVTGVRLGVRDLNGVDSSVQALKRALSNIGVQAAAAPLTSDFFPDEKLVLVIGARE